MYDEAPRTAAMNDVNLVPMHGICHAKTLDVLEKDEQIIQKHCAISRLVLNVILGCQNKTRISKSTNEFTQGSQVNDTCEDEWKLPGGRKPPRGRQVRT